MTTSTLVVLLLLMPALLFAQAESKKRPDRPVTGIAKDAAKKGAPTPMPVPPNVKALRDIAYVPGGHERQKLDLYVPEGAKNLPLVVWIHGGGWQNGSKDRTQALRLVTQGYAVASVNYRLSSHAVFPAQIEDCKAAIRWLRANARAHGIDGGRIGVWGSSAGGHLVAMLGVTGDVKEFDQGPNLGESSRVQAVVDFFGPTELFTMQKQTVIPGPIQHDAPDSPESKLIGATVGENKAKADKASPITYVTKDDAPILIMHGDKDPLVPVKQSEEFHARLKKAGVDSTLHIEPGAGHSLPGAHIMEKVEAFLARHLKPLPKE